MSFFSKIFGDPNDRYIRSLHPLVQRINALEPEMQKRSDDELRGLTLAFRKRLAAGETLDDLLPEAFAAVREAAVRGDGKRHFDVQLMGGIVLHQGKIAQMSTGEGKTLVATLPAYVNALSGQGVHVVTVNDYLSRRDASWMGKIYDALGMSVGILNHEAAYLYDPSFTGGVHECLRPVPRRQAYEADITYGTNNEYGFDYLRDNMAPSLDAMAQRPEHTHTYAIVDEVDSILIDEARTPLIISAPDEESGELYRTFSRIAPHLKAEEDYTVDEKLKAVSITDAGINKVQERLGLTDLYEEGGIQQVHHLENALKAQVLFHRDQDYVVKDGKVVIVDEFTGRMMPGRRWSDGLHQAIEAKEGVAVEKESRTLATITFQNYFRLYKKLAGMTGTARTSAEEFHTVYKLDVMAVPTNKPMIRQDLSDRIYKTESGKFRALAKEIKRVHDTGQPVLVGTVSIEKNELLAALLTAQGVPHQILNAKNHEREADIIAAAGQRGAVTVATNMAGRGVDIILGQGVAVLGGLAVFGTERHEARRIDDQLRGRAGRQGDPGTSRFYVSCEDDLARIFGGDRLKNIMDRLGVGEEDVIENRLVSSSIAQAQSRIEGHNFDARKYVLEYDDVMNKHRHTLYGLRHAVLTQDNRQRVLDWLADDETRARYEEHETKVGAEQLRKIERMVILSIIDDIWVEHIDAMERLRESVRLRAYGQRDPLVEYKIESQRMYAGLIDTVADRVAQVIFQVGVVPAVQTPRHITEGRGLVLDPVADAAIHRHDEEDPAASEGPIHSSDVGRNDPCPCGSGKKYKKCGLLNTEEHQKLSGK